MKEAILHADLDAFYTSVEAIRNPSLQGKPVVVGTPSARGVVISASYESRKFGIRSGIPSIKARRLCPEVIFVPADFEAYTEFSKRVFEIFTSFTPLVERLSLDEAFLNVSRASQLFGDPIQIAHALRYKVRTELGIRISVGVACNKLVAKIASSKAKPDGCLLIPAEKTAEFLEPLAPAALWGVGPLTAQRLHRLGIHTLGELRRVSRVALDGVFGDGLAGHLFAGARGKDDRPVLAGVQHKSLGAEQTFECDLCMESEVLRELLRLADLLGKRLRKRGLCAKTVTLKVRLANFTTLERSCTADPVNSTASIFLQACRLYRKTTLCRPGQRTRIRLLGLIASGLVDGPPPQQLTLARRPNWAEADKVVDALRVRFGERKLGLAALLPEGIL